MKKFILVFSFFLVTSIVFTFSVLSYFILSLPSEQQIKGCFETTMYKINLCPGGNNYVRLPNISEFVKRALIQTEDAAFYSHKGFDWDELKNSFEKNLSKGKFARGGSTITQQLAKNLFLTKEKTIWRKLKEAVITLQLEHTLKKNEILERYLNVVQFGPNIFGVKQASNFYFKKHPSELNVVESSFLIFLLPSPEKYSHSYFRKELTSFARKRMRQIISGMVQTNRITPEEYNAAMGTLEFFPNSPPIDPSAQEVETIPSLEDLENEDESL